MQRAELTRQRPTLTAAYLGTFGVFRVDAADGTAGFKCFTVELPWSSNESNKSCIPEGEYLVEWDKSAKHGMCYHLRNVPGRTHIQIHPANYAHQLLGCISPGKKIEPIAGTMGVSSSRDTLTKLEEHMKKEPFILNIKWGD